VAAQANGVTLDALKRLPKGDDLVRLAPRSADFWQRFMASAQQVKNGAWHTHHSFRCELAKGSPFCAAIEEALPLIRRASPEDYDRLRTAVLAFRPFRSKASAGTPGCFAPRALVANVVALGVIYLGPRGHDNPLGWLLHELGHAATTTPDVVARSRNLEQQIGKYDVQTLLRLWPKEFCSDLYVERRWGLGRYIRALRRDEHHHGPGANREFAVRNSQGQLDWFRVTRDYYVRPIERRSP
jgi:hypothetical protein